MKRVALIGHPLGHSVSPAMQNAAFAALGLAWQYLTLNVPPESLPPALDELRRESWVGANVTIPHKERVIRLLDGLTGQARSVGAVNTIFKREGRLVGDNTDVAGFLADLRAQGVEPEAETAVVLGAGGAARAVACALASLGMGLHIVCRREAQGLALAQAVDRLAPVKIFPWTAESFRQAAGGCSLLVNATPLGMAPASRVSPWPREVPLPEGAFVYDLVYNPRRSSLVRRAQHEGLRASGGLGMLVEQGALALERWTGATAPRAVMRRAAVARLEALDVAVPDRR